MKCTKCGNKILPNQAFCSVCGSPVERQNQSYQENNGNGGKKGIPVWLTIVLILVVVAIMLVIMFVLLNNKEDSKSDNKKDVVENNVVVSNAINDVAPKNTSANNVSGNTISQTNTATSYYKVKLENCQLKVPDNLIYKVNGEELMLMDEDATWVAQVCIQEGSFSSFTESNVASYLRSAGMTVNNTKETTIGGLNAIVSEITMSGINMLVAYVRINSMYMGCIALYSSDYATYDYNSLNTVAKVLTTVQISEEEPSTSVNLSTDNFSKFSDYLKNQNN